MITNERQYLITQALKAMRDGAQSQLAELEEQIAEYDALRAGMIVSIKAR
jgi:hypothetical protein